MIIKTPIARWNGDTRSELDDDVAREREVRITCGTYSFTTYCSALDYEDLGVGHAYAEGLVTSGIPGVDITAHDMYDRIDVAGDDNETVDTPYPSIRLEHRTVQSMARKVADSSPLFDKTGAFHYAFVFDDAGKELASAYDIGRFNAIDKAVGHCIRHDITLHDKVLFSTGRISGRTVAKASALGIPAIVSKAPPFYEPVLRAQSLGITLLGFARNASFNVYTTGRAQVE